MIYFEKGTLPSGEQADLCVVEAGAGRVGKFPADALTQDGRTTYREQYAAQYDAYKNGDVAEAKPMLTDKVSSPPSSTFPPLKSIPANDAAAGKSDPLSAPVQPVAADP